MKIESFFSSHALSINWFEKHTYDGDIVVNNFFEILEILAHNSYGYEYQLPKYESM